MSSGQWDLQALEAIEREASQIFDVLDVPERLRSPAKQKQCLAKKVSSSAASPSSSCGVLVVDSNDNDVSHPHLHSQCGGGRGGAAEEEENVDLELQDHIKHCSCSCNHMGYGNYMDYQVTLPLINSPCFPCRRGGGGGG